MSVRVVEIDGVRTEIARTPLSVSVVAPARDFEGLALVIYPDRLGRGSLRGGRHFRIGDENLDDRFVFRGNDLGYARAWIGPRQRDELLRSYETRFSVGPAVAEGRSWAIPFGLPTWAEEVMAQAVAALATRGKELVAAWRDAAEALEGTFHGDRWTLDGSLGIELHIQDHAVRIDVLRRDVVETRVRVLRSHHDGFSVARYGHDLHYDRGWGEFATGLRSYRGRAADGVLTAGRLRRCARLILESDPASIEADTKYIAVYLKGFEMGPTRLRIMANLAVGLAQADDGRDPTVGPYR